MHDGSRLRLRKLDHAYDATNIFCGIGYAELSPPASKPRRHRTAVSSLGSDREIHDPSSALFPNRARLRRRIIGFVHTLHPAHVHPFHARRHILCGGHHRGHVGGVHGLPSPSRAGTGVAHSHHAHHGSHVHLLVAGRNLKQVRRLRSFGDIAELHAAAVLALRLDRHAQLGSDPGCDPLALIRGVGPLFRCVTVQRFRAEGARNRSPSRRCKGRWD